MITQPSHFKERLFNFTVLNIVGLGYYIINMMLKTNAPYTSLNMPWEANIPFVSWIIFPYLSYFLVAVLIFLLPYKREKLAIYMFRFLFVAFITFTIFIVFPFQNAYTRPIEEYNGVMWVLFELLKEDLPYNQMPSFHISFSLLYTVIIIDFFEHKLIKSSIILWFILICCSVLMMLQHHFADIISAIILVLLTIYISNIPSIKERILKIYISIYHAWISLISN